jgi:putative ABC transport system permease protein
MAALWHDLRYTLRLWRRSPSFALVVILTVALAVGATTAIFSVVNGVLLEPLPYPQPGRVLFLWSSNLEAGLPIFGTTPHDFVDLKKQTESFQYLSARRSASFNLTGDRGEPERLPGERVSEDYFPALGLKPVVGRTFLPEEQVPGGPKVAVLEHRVWERRFASDPAIVGKTLLLDGERYTVVGVVHDPLRGAVSEIWTPLALDVTQEPLGLHSLHLIGRLKPGATMERAQAEATAVAARLEQERPDTNSGWRFEVAPMHEMIVRDVKPRLLILLGAVFCVLLIACANLANLFLARISHREREIAVRAALGAGRGRVMRQLLTESLLYALAGGGLGVLLATWGTRALLSIHTKAVPRSGEVGMDLRVLGFALLVSLLTGLAVGLWPAVQATRSDLYGPLKEGSRTMAGGVRSRLLRDAFVLAEVALALILLIGAGLLIKSFARLADIDPGFRSEGVLTSRLYLPPAKFVEPARQAAVYKAVLERVQAIPGVETAGVISRLPLSEGVSKRLFYTEGKPVTPSEAPASNMRMVTPDTFRALGIPLLRGRGPLPQDTAEGQQVVVVNQALARRMWPGEDPIGKRLTYDVGAPEEETTWVTVVGLVPDMKTTTLDRETDMESYLPVDQYPTAEGALVVRTAGNPVSLAPALRDAVRKVDPDLPVYDVKTMERLVADSLSSSRFSMFLFGLFAALALVLASVGVYGVISYSVAQRTREIGIRMAMGADRGDVLRMVLRQSLVIALIGVAVGLACAVGLTRFLAGQLFGVSATDPVIFLAVAALLTAVAAVASWVPARRATGVDPLMAMR